MERPNKFAKTWRHKEYGVRTYLERNGIINDAEHDVIIDEYCAEHGFSSEGLHPAVIFKVKIAFIAGHFGRFQYWFEQKKRRNVAAKRPI